MEFGLVILLLSAGFGAAAEAHRGLRTHDGVGLQSMTGINPDLHPTSDKKFFDGAKADYVTDMRPAVKDHFTWPFPEVQDSHDYDKDYVKDENNDGGAYKAQSTYDSLRAKLAKQKAELEELKRHEDNAHDEVDEAQKKEDAAHKKADDARKKADEAGKQGVDGPSGDLGEMTGKVEAEIKDLQDCKEQLKKAKDKLEKAIKERKAAEETHNAAALEEEKAKAKEAAALAEENKEAAKLKQEEVDHDGALEGKKTTAAEVKKMEADLEEAAKQLRKHRNADGSASTRGQNGGVYRSGAVASAVPPLAFLVAAAAQLLA